MDIIIKSGKILLGPGRGLSHMDNVELEDVISDKSPAKSEKLRDIEKNSAKVE